MGSTNFPEGIAPGDDPHDGRHGKRGDHFHIITDTAKNVKMLIISPFLMSRVGDRGSDDDPSAPRGLTAAVGIDALTHAIEPMYR
jgi:1,3-propanediol dehydrogenase